MFDWTDTRTAQLKTMWADGLSVSQIACELNVPTRNAVIGKAHRLGLSKPPKEPAQTTRRIVNQVPHVRRIKMARQVIESVEDVAPRQQRCSLLELTDETCRWPIGDPRSLEFYFCGAMTREFVVEIIGTEEIKKRSPYCNYHSLAAYQPEQVRKPRPYRPGPNGERAA